MSCLALPVSVRGSLHQMDSHIALCHEFLRKMAVPGYRNTFVLGSFAKRVTIRSQQVRALNLIYSLTKTSELNSGDKVAVIGAGFAGLTAAAAAMREGYSVTVLERSLSRLSLQRNCRHRYLHPHIYDWPAAGSLNLNADLPVLDWKADTAESVVRQVDDQFDSAQGSARAAYREVFKAESINILPAGTLLWSESNATRREDFAAVILAVGFGLETGGPDASYWADSSLDFSALDNPNMKLLVSGSGDGALTDLMRLCIMNFRHDQVLSTLTSASSLEDVRMRNSRY
jgi:hypothetical protein